MTTDNDQNRSGGERITANEEVRLLPRGWEMRGTGESNRVAFYSSSGSQAAAAADGKNKKKKKRGTFDHPVLGPLPRPWELRKRAQGQFVYHNAETGESAPRGPRKISRRSGKGSATAAMTMTTTTTTPPPGAIAVRSSGQHGRLRRQETSRAPLHGEYERVRCLDDGLGAVGGMNDGIYVVRKKATGQLFVEKNYGGGGGGGGVPAHLVTFIKSEIDMMKSLIHSSIIHYVASFVQDDPFRATV